MTRPSESPATPELGELLAQAGWMRALARSLVTDPDEAEEVVQEAWVVALGRRSAVRIDLSSWLRTVVRNLARRRAGRESRRPGVERLAARAESSAGAGGEVRDAVERMELQRWLAEALLRLAEPYRSAVILRHVEGLDPGAIPGVRAAVARPRASASRVAWPSCARRWMQSTADARRGACSSPHGSDARPAPCPSR